MRALGLLIEALAEQPCVLTVMGSRMECESLKVMFAKHLQAGRLEVLAAQEDEAVAAALHAAALFIILDRETQSDVGLHDAMGAGLAIIDAAGRPAPDSWHRHGETGLIMPRGDVRGIARAVNATAKQPDRLRNGGCAPKPSPAKIQSALRKTMISMPRY